MVIPIFLLLVDVAIVTVAIVLSLKRAKAQHRADAARAEMTRRGMQARVDSQRRYEQAIRELLRDL